MGIRPVFEMSQKTFVRNSTYTKSPFRYPGGKYYALKYIMPFLNCVPHDEYREPFIGGGSVFFAKAKAQYNWINDLESELIATYRVMADPILRQELVKRVTQETANPARHSEVKDYKPETVVDMAYRTYYLNRTSYSGIIHKPAWGYRDGKSSPPENWGEFIKGAGKKLEGIKITSLDFEDVIQAPTDNTSVLLYLDPPYFHADQKRAYTKSFSESDHLRLARMLRETPFLFCLSYDDCSEIRDLYSWAEVYEQQWLYNTANINGKKRKVGRELIITNYTVSKTFQPRLF